MSQTIIKLEQANKSDFSITIDFDRGSKNPSRVFNAMSQLIESLESFDSDLVRHLDNNIETILLLEDVEVGSLKAVLKNALQKIPDNSLSDMDWKKAIGHYLVKGKYILISLLDGKTTISDDASEIKEIEKGLIEAARETGVSQMSNYVAPTRQMIIKNLDSLTKAKQPLSDSDKIIYTSAEGTATFNTNFDFSIEDLEDLMAKETLSSTSKMILKVKKPDYLGDSQWAFKHGKETISAKIEDQGWLNKFQARDIDVRPQDSLVCEVRTTIKYDDNLEVISKKQEILEVVSVNRRVGGDQLTIEG